MSIMTYRLQTAAFPEDYAEILMEVLAFTPANFLSVKDALYHFRTLEDDQAAEAMRRIAESVEPASPGNERVSRTHMPTTHGDFNAPWSLRFERDGTEAFAVIYDADDDELVRSRHFWLPMAGDPVPSTLAAMRLIVAAPTLLDALVNLLTQIEGAYDDIDISEAEAAIGEATTLLSPNN